MTQIIKVTKLDAARRQLETAVRLYFNDADPISIHTLVCAAHEVLLNLNANRQTLPMILSDSRIVDEYKAKFNKMIREVRNFFKHADKDPENTLDFKPQLNEYLLLDACEGDELLTSEKNPYFITYRGWFHYRHRDILRTITGEMVQKYYGDNKLVYFSNMLTAAHHYVQRLLEDFYDDKASVENILKTKGKLKTVSA